MPLLTELEILSIVLKTTNMPRLTALTEVTFDLCPSRRFEKDHYGL